MKKLLTIIGACATVLMTSFSAEAQKGSVGLGLRATPDGGGFNVKTYFTDNLAFEGQANIGGVLGLEGESFNTVALLEGNVNLPNPSWKLFFGGGLHAGVWDRGVGYRSNDGFLDDNPEGFFGADGIAGVEYMFDNIPLGLSADVKPAVNFTDDGPEFFPHNLVGFTARYYIR